jgi:3-oxoacyl-[acyl-carrier protein] reductase
MDLGLREKAAVVTGASKGIGRSIALRRAEGGAGVATCDVGDPEALDGFLEAAHASLGRVDILVNNPSGIGFADDPATWQSTLNVDLMPAVRAGWKVTPWMAGWVTGVCLAVDGAQHKGNL